MKRTLKKSIVALLLASLLLTALAGAAYADTVYASDGRSFIRSQPNLSGHDLGVLPAGASATYLGQSTDERGVVWYRISYGNITGWVSSMYTSLNGSASYRSVNGVVVASGGDSYIRDTYYRSGNVLGLLPEGASANYLGQSAADERGVIWYKITYGTTTGWVSSRYTTLKGASSGYSVPSDSGSGYSRVTGVSGDSNIRNAPSLSASEVGMLPKGASASYLGQTQYDDRGVAWYYVTYNGRTGWVSSRYTSLQ